MSKYNALWEYVQKSGKESFQLTFEEIQMIAGVPSDHSFLKYKCALGNSNPLFYKASEISEITFSPLFFTFIL